MKSEDQLKLFIPESTTPILIQNLILKRSAQGKEIKLFLLKQLLQRLSMALAQVQTCNTLEDVLNKIRWIVAFFSDQTNKISKQVYKNLINLL